LDWFVFGFGTFDFLTSLQTSDAGEGPLAPLLFRYGPAAVIAECECDSG